MSSRSVHALVLSVAAVLACSKLDRGGSVAGWEPRGDSLRPAAAAEPAGQPWAECVAKSRSPARYRHITLDEYPLHLGSASESGMYNLFIFGASWCPPCHDVLAHVPEILQAHPDLVVTYLDLGEQNSTAVQQYFRRSGQKKIPYAYLADQCGLGMTWIAAGEAFTARLKKSLARWMPQVSERDREGDVVESPVRFSFKGSPRPVHAEPGRPVAPTATVWNRPPEGSDKLPCAEWEISRIAVRVDSVGLDEPSWEAPESRPNLQIIIIVRSGVERGSPVFSDSVVADWEIQPPIRARRGQFMSVLVDDHRPGGSVTLVSQEVEVPAIVEGELRRLGPFDVRGRCISHTTSGEHDSDG